MLANPVRRWSARLVLRKIWSVLCGRSEQGRRFNLVERTVSRDISARLGDPELSIGRAGQAHGLGQRLVHVARGEALPCAKIACVRVHGESSAQGGSL